MHTTFTTASLIAVLSTVFLGSVPQDQQKPAPTNKFVLEAGEHDLVQVIEASGKFLERSYLLAPSEIGTESLKVKLPRRLELDAAGCEAVVSQLAYRHNLIATPLDRGRGIWEFLNMNGARRGDAMSRSLAVSPAEVRQMRDVRVIVSTRVVVQHARATVLTQTLRPFFAGAGGAGGCLNIGTSGTERLILLQGLSDLVNQALDMIAEGDQPEPLGKVEDDRLTSLEKRVAALEAAGKPTDGK